MSAPRLLIVGDAGAPTGFERVVRGIAEYLHTAGTYAVTVRGIGYTRAAEAALTYPWTVKPWGGQAGDPLGVTQVPRWLEEDRPDQVLFVQDLWNIANYAARLPRDFPATCYFPVDTPNLKPTYGLGLGAMRTAATYTRFGATEAAASVRRVTDQILQANAGHEGVRRGELTWATLPKGEMELHIRFDRMARYQNPDAWDVVPHGLDRGLFEPRDQATARAKFGIPADAFVVLNVNTNQFRKRLDLTVRAFRALLWQVPEAFLVLHCAGGDRDGWDLYDLVDYYGIPKDRVACVHYASPRLPNEDLCWLYNTADVQINTAGGEGWGLTSFEGAACGVPQAVPDWSATRELWRDHGYLIPVANYRTEPKYLNTMHAEIDVPALVSWLVDMAWSPARCRAAGSRAFDFAQGQPTWDEVGAQMAAVLARAAAEPPTAGLTAQALLAARAPQTLTSELATRPLWRPRS